jgi:hypothetical protein
MLAGSNAPSPSGGSGAPSGRIPGAPDGAEAGSQISDMQQKAASADAKLNTDIKSLRDAEATLMEMAQSYPTATKSLRTASDALRAARRQIVSSPGTAEPPVPNTYA